MPHDLFLSYTRVDAIIMQRIRDELTAEELSVWTDVGYLDNQIGTPHWEKEIENAIKAASGLVVLLSPESNQSPWVANEISFASALGIRIFPVLVRGDEKTAVPIRLINYQRIDIRIQSSYPTEIGKLITSICNHLGKQRLSQQRAEPTEPEKVETHKVQQPLPSNNENARRALIILNYQLNNKAAVKELDELLRLYTQQKRSDQIISLLEELVSQVPNDMALRSRLAAIYVQVNRRNDAIAQLDALGELQLEAGLYQDACSTVKQIITLRPADVEQYKNLFAQLGC